MKNKNTSGFSLKSKTCKGFSLRNKVCKGFSLIEIMIVITIFALLGVLVTQSLALSIRGSKKSEASSNIRTSLSNAVGIIERQIRNADSIRDCTPTVPGEDKVNYVDEFGTFASFSCSGGSIASASATYSSNLIDSNLILLSLCEIDCTPATEETLGSIKVKLTGKDRKTLGAETAEVDIESKILLRNY